MFDQLYLQAEANAKETNISVDFASFGASEVFAVIQFESIVENLNKNHLIFLLFACIFEKFCFHFFGRQKDNLHGAAQEPDPAPVEIFGNSFQIILQLLAVIVSVNMLTETGAISKRLEN